MSQAAGTTEQGPPLMTVAEAAEALRMGYRGTLAAIRRGQLPASRIGKEYRLRRCDLDALVAPVARVDTPPHGGVTP